MIEVGAKVVCVDDDFSMYPTINQVYQALPVKHEIYVVRDIRPIAIDGGILLDEIHNRPTFFDFLGGFLEPAFNAKRFVPLDLLMDEIQLKIEEPIRERISC